MKHLMLLFCLLIPTGLFAQEGDTTYRSLKDALRNPMQVKRLDLSNQSLKDISLEKFPNLEVLSLRNDRLRKLPKGITGLKKLRVLDLSGNSFRKLPEELKELPELEELYLDEERNFDFTNGLAPLLNMQQLRVLHLEGNNLTFIPKEVFQMPSLQQLDLRGNQLQGLPKMTEPLPRLKLIELGGNPIKGGALDSWEDYGIRINLRR